MNTSPSLAPSPDENLRRMALALGHPTDTPVTVGGLESLVDMWVRAVAIIARHVGAPDARNPMGVAQAVEDRVAGRPAPPRAVPAPAAAPAAAPAPAAPAAASAPAAQSAAHGAEAIRAFVRDGHLYIELSGAAMRVTKLTLAAP